MVALSGSAHIYARPEYKEQLVWLFTVILGCQLVFSSDAPHAPAPVIAFRFPNGGALSVEFTRDALDERQARWGAWLEVKADDAPALQRKILEAGLPQVSHPSNDHFYFAAPGGQVLRIVPAAEQ